MKKTIILIGLIFSINIFAVTVKTRPDYSALSYTPNGDAIERTNGKRWCNRPLYCKERKAIVFAGEQPLLYSPLGKLTFAVSDGKQTKFLHTFEKRLMRYRPGQIEWQFSDPAFGKALFTIKTTTLAEATGYVVRISAKGNTQPLSLAWCFVTPTLEKKRSYNLTANAAKFSLLPDSAIAFSDIQGHFSTPVERWEIVDKKNLDPTPRVNSNTTGWYNEMPESYGAADFLTMKENQSFDGKVLKLQGLVAWQTIKSGNAITLAMIADDKDQLLIGRYKKLNPQLIENPMEAYEKSMSRVEALARRVKVNTPDKYLNSGVSASVAAVCGLYVDPCFVHGGSAWRSQMPGWRTMSGSSAYGWHDRIYKALKYWTSQMITKDNGKTEAALSISGAQQEPSKSRMFGKGYMDYHQPEHYEFQTQFFDEAVREWRATGDKEFEKLLMPNLELHLERCKICFDPDDDGLYESVVNTWPSDSQWYNGGGSVEQSAYCYYGFKALAEMKRNAGDTTAAKKYEDECSKIQLALDKTLWLKDKGQYAAYIEQGGHKRVHSDAWIYSEHLPIEAGLSTPQQAWQAMYYTEWAMERFLLPYGGEMRQTSNWVPGQWSIRELFHGDNFAMALGHFLCGQGNEGWQLLSGTMKETMYGDQTKKTGYSNEIASFNRPNIESPGGLSHPNCGIDFNDITTMFVRSVVEGLFGYRPDYPNAKVVFAPSFPAEWNYASMAAPDFSIAFKQNGNKDEYRFTLTKKAGMTLRLPIRADKVKKLMVNNKSVSFHIEPQTGYGMLVAEVPASNEVTVKIELADRRADIEAVEVEKEAGETLTVQAENGNFQGIEDPQQVLENVKTNGMSLTATCTNKPGFHMIFAKTGGEVPYYQVIKLKIKNNISEKNKAEKLQQMASESGTWTPVDMSAQFNGDIRSIFKQRYESPRPNTASARIGYDGWSAWTFRWWRFPAPEIKLDNMEKLTSAEGLLKTPQNALFKTAATDKNIAFTSLWDNWPKSVTVPVGKQGEQLWLLVCGSTNPMQGHIENAVLRFQYADGAEETLNLCPPTNFWSLCKFGTLDYDYKRDAFSLPQNPPMQVQLGQNCRAMVYGWKLRPGVVLKSVTLEALSQEVVIGLMGVSVRNK